MKLLTLFFALTLSVSLFAEGTREVAPNANIVITGNNTTDIAALLIDNSEYNNFATYSNGDPNSRLYIHITDPQTECVFVGFSFGHANATGMNPQRMAYEYRVRDPNGNVVFGPVAVPTNGGNIMNWSQANTGPMQIYGAGGYNAVQISSADLMSQGWSGAGDYFIEFNHDTGIDGLLIDFWDISVSDCTEAPLVEKKGRVWSYNWAFFAINDFGFPIRPFNGAFYVCAPDPDNPEAAFITKIDFNGADFRPAAFNIAFNSFGSVNTGDVMFDRRSVQAANTTQAEYAVFLNDPVDLCETAEPGEIELLGVSRCGAEDYCIKFLTEVEGQIDLLLDFDGPDDVYTSGTSDVMIAIQVGPEQVGVPSCVFWDGTDGLGNTLPEDISTEIPVVISFAQGIYHFPIYDAEFMTAGVRVEAIRPLAPEPLLYYDDSNISVLSGSGEPVVQLSGCTTPCHRWTTFTDPNIPGFGNLNTINSWWFSQRIVRSELFFLPAYLVCDAIGPAQICEGDTTTLTVFSSSAPEGSGTPEVLGWSWQGPEILGSTTNPTVSIAGGGIYGVEVSWLTLLGDTCSSVCEVQVDLDPVTFGSIDTLIIQGETVEINGETYGEGGIYNQTLVSANGCDSILTITVTVLQTVVHFDLDACLSIPTEGSHAIYTEFTAEYPQPLSCADLVATFVHRDNPTVNTHSCTPGVNDSPAMCVSSLDSCTYDPGNEQSIVFELTVTPAADTTVAITGLTFYERAPEMFDWINGDTGPNNYPTLYAVRILKDGTEIYRQADIATTTDWTLEEFDFLGLDDFEVDAPATFRFEFLGYCLIDNGAVVPAWDLDEIRVIASCGSPSPNDGIISGRVLTEFGQKIKDVRILLADEPTFLSPSVSMTDAQGAYSFSELPTGDQFYLHASKNTDFLQGVSTLDLIKMQKHLLGLRPFDSPLQYLAADINGNQAISALDLAQLRRVILGVYAEFPGNTSWRFGDPHQELLLTDPWVFEEIVEVPREEIQLENLNFLAVKIGDVNGSIQDLTTIDTRSGAALRFEIKDHEVRAGDLVKIDVRSAGFTDVVGFQFALALQDALLHDVISGAIDVTDAFATGSDREKLRMSWNQITPQAVAAEDVLFTIVLQASQGGMMSELFWLNDEDMISEAYVGADDEIIDIEFNVNQQTDTRPGTQMFYNTPNPFSTETDIRFYISEAGIANISIYSVQGQLVHHVSDRFEIGEHRITISKQDAGLNTGVYICQLESNGVLESQRMIVLD